MLSKPYFILWLGTVLFMMIAFFMAILPQTSFAIKLYDTYFVIAHFHIWAVFAIFLGLLGLGYWLMDRFGLRLWLVFSYLHILATLLSVGGLVYFDNTGIAGYPRRYYSFDNYYTWFQENSSFIFVSVFFLSQILGSATDVMLKITSIPFH
ncbi:MAG: hypothetical protein MUE85_23370 [Microscillaceae bacterium]|nr:hypothetical protein [Microscillaceae bacterium]